MSVSLLGPWRAILLPSLPPSSYLDISELAEGGVGDGLDGTVARLHKLIQVRAVDAVVLEFGNVPEVNDDLVVEGEGGEREGGKGEEEEEEEEREEERLKRRDDGGEGHSLSAYSLPSLMIPFPPHSRLASP